MQSTFKTLFFRIRNSNFVVSVSLLLLLYFGFYVIWTPLDFLLLEKWDVIFMPTPNDTLMTRPIYIQILVAVIIGPLIETLIFQKWLYKLLSLIKWLKQRKLLIMIIGALVFGAVHIYSLLYIVFAVFMGFLFMFAYVARIGKNPFWTVFVLHALTNLFVILTDSTVRNIFGIT